MARTDGSPGTMTPSDPKVKSRGHSSIEWTGTGMEFMPASPSIDSVVFRLSKVIKNLKTISRRHRSSNNRPTSEMEKEQEELEAMTDRVLTEVRKLLVEAKMSLEKAGHVTPES